MNMDNVYYLTGLIILGSTFILVIGAAYITRQLTQIEYNKARIYAIHGCKEPEE